MTRAGVASEDLRRTNLSHVLRLLHVTGPATRAEVTAAVGLNRSTVATLVAELVEDGLVAEAPARSTGGPGRPSPLVSVRTDTVAVLAVDVKVDSVAAGLVSLGGTMLRQERLERPRSRTDVASTLHDLEGQCRRMLAGLAPEQRLLGLGASVAGLVRLPGGTVHVAPNLQWRDVPLAARLGERLGLDLPTLALNDADAGALAERRRGAGRDVDHMLYLSGEVGVGAGVIAHGALLTGRDGFAGEAGHMVVDADGLRCTCGRAGCWETRIGEAALLRLAGEPEDGGREAVDRVLAQVEAGDATARGAVDELAWWMGVGIVNVVNVLNPQRIVLGDLHARLHAHVVDAVQARLAADSLVAQRSPVEVVAAELGDDAALVGAAEAVLDGLLDDPLGARHATTPADVRAPPARAPARTTT